MLPLPAVNSCRICSKFVTRLEGYSVTIASAVLPAGLNLLECSHESMRNLKDHSRNGPRFKNKIHTQTILQYTTYEQSGPSDAPAKLIKLLNLAINDLSNQITRLDFDLIGSFDPNKSKSNLIIIRYRPSKTSFRSVNGVIIDNIIGNSS